jgi:hypothetical protein
VDTARRIGPDPSSTVGAQLNPRLRYKSAQRRHQTAPPIVPTSGAQLTPAIIHLCARTLEWKLPNRFPSKEDTIFARPSSTVETAALSRAAPTESDAFFNRAHLGAFSGTDLERRIGSSVGGHADKKLSKAPMDGPTAPTRRQLAPAGWMQSLGVVSPLGESANVRETIY